MIHELSKYFPLIFSLMLLVFALIFVDVYYINCSLFSNTSFKNEIITR